MLKCLVLRNRCTPRYLASSRKFYATERFPAEDVLSEEQELERPLATPLAAEHIREEPSTRSENAATGTITRSPRPHLPLSPLMDPVYLAARIRHRLPKAPPSKEPTPFQKQLAKNPYALALATPVRICSLTRTYLPNFFLQDFEVIAHPDTGEPWYMPRSLTSKHSPKPKTNDDPALSESAERPRKPPTLGPKGYVISRMSLLNALTTKHSGYQYGWQRFISANMRESKKYRKALNFRKDMNTFVLELFRRRIVESLKYLCGLKRGYLTACKDAEAGRDSVWEDAKMKKGTAAMLWLGPRAGSDGMETAPPQGTAPPEEFGTIDVDKDVKSKIPVHNLVSLLGTRYVEDLRRHAPQMFGAEVVVLKSKRNTVDLQLLLWKLQGYLATYEDSIQE